MRKIFVFILSIVAVFFTFAGCDHAYNGNNNANNTTISGNMESSEDDGEESQGSELQIESGESDREESQSSEQEKPPQITDPITDGGNFNGGNYN